MDSQREYVLWCVCVCVCVWHRLVLCPHHAVALAEHIHRHEPAPAADAPCVYIVCAWVYCMST